MMATAEMFECSCLPFGGASLALTVEADPAERQFMGLHRFPEPSLTAAQRLADASREINTLISECADDDWDGYGAKAVDNASCFRAICFMVALPTDVPPPEVGVDPDGEVSLDWIVGPQRVFSVSIGGKGELHYAGLFGRARSCGNETFLGEVPAAVSHNLRRLLLSTNT